MSQNRLVILDCDGGSDDAWALMLLLKAEEVKEITLLGITISGCGNTDLHNAARNMYRILKACQRTEIPIYFGAPQSLLPPQATIDESRLFHGRDGFGDVLPTEQDLEIEKLVQQEHAVVALQRFCAAHAKQVSIIAVGPLTNIALCYAMYGSDFGKNIRDIYIMGGNYQGVGNFSRSAEFNFYRDPEAAHAVLAKSSCPIIILPWEACLEERFFVCIDWRLDVFGSSTAHPALDMLTQVDRALWKQSDYKSWMPCDAMLVAAFLFESLCVRKKSLWHATVELNGITRGQMVLDHMHEFDKNIQIIESLDADAFKNMVQWSVGLCENFFIDHQNENKD